jgi:hypothetical protein
MAANTNTLVEPNNRTPDGNGPEQSPPRLALAPARGQELTGMLGELAKLYLLNVNGTSLLTTRAAMEIKLIAVMLTINFIFDLVVWTSLWNMVFYTGKWVLGPRSLLALFCGLLFAAIIFVYERQFMTADTYRRFRKVWAPVMIRLAIIGIAAAITTQPFEVMIFSGPVERRIHEESVRVEALSRLRSFEEAALRSRGELGLKGTIAAKTLADAKTDLQNARDETAKFSAEAVQARADQRNAEGAIRSAQQQLARARTKAQVAGASRRLSNARQRFEDARNAGDRAEAQAAESKKAEDQRGADVETAKGAIEEKEQLAEGDVKRLQDWITQIRNAKPGAKVIENRTEQPQWQYEDQDYDFFQRLGVINDLYYGRPARWLGINPDKRGKLSQAYNLSEADQNDPLNQERIEADAKTFRYSYWAVIAVAAVIPLLLLALKGLLPIDLKRYYSTAAQQAAGNYETLRFSSAQMLSARFEETTHSTNGNHSTHRGLRDPD